MQTPKNRISYLDAARTELRNAVVSIEAAKNFIRAGTGLDNLLNALNEGGQTIQNALEELEGTEPTPAEADAEEETERKLASVDAASANVARKHLRKNAKK